MDSLFKVEALPTKADRRITKSVEELIIKKSERKDFGTHQFLSNLYAYPPKFSVYRKVKGNGSFCKINLPSITINDTFHSFLSSDKFNLSTHQSFPGLNSLRPLLLSEPKTPHELSRDIVPKSIFSSRDYFNGYWSRNFTGAKPFRKILETTPVYVILNGQEKIVLGHEENFGDPAIPNNKLYDICGAFADKGTLKKGKLGLVFFGYNDAKNFMDAILELAPEESKVVGLAVHCVSLESVYDLMRSYHPGIDFRLIPNMTDLMSSFSIAKDSRFIFQEELDNVKSNVVTKHANRDLSDLNVSQLQNLTKGVSVYSVKLQESKRGVLKVSLRSFLNKADSFISFFVRPHKLGRKIMKGQLPKVEDYPDDTSTYIFFNYRDALDFCKVNNRFVIPFSGSYLGSRFNRVVQKPIIFVTNLETLLEQWEDKLPDAENLRLKDISTTYNFVPAHESAKLWDTQQSKLLNSPMRSMFRTIKVRYRILASLIEYIWLA